MATSRNLVLLLCGVICINVWIVGIDGQKPVKPKKVKKNRVTVTIVNRRLVTAEKKLESVSNELEETKNKLEQLEAKVAALSRQGDAINGGSPGAQQPMATKFSDLPPCPGVDGFFYSEEMKSCYHLEPPSILANYTEAARLCSEIHPKSHIVAVNNQLEQTFLREKWFHERGIASISRFWMNLKKVPERNQWKWDHDKRRLLFSHWIPTTSHNDDRFQCAAVYSNEAYFWGDVACWGPHMVTCEIDM